MNSEHNRYRYILVIPHVVKDNQVIHGLYYNSHARKRMWLLYNPLDILIIRNEVWNNRFISLCMTYTPMDFFFYYYWIAFYFLFHVFLSFFFHILFFLQLILINEEMNQQILRVKNVNKCISKRFRIGDKFNKKVNLTKI